ncbi:MAG: signal recognition particle-docking protein FtsY [Actinomycetes bacterium]|jgi:fused signal recognition particle receptor
MALFSKIIAKLRGGSVAASDWEELRTVLIEADLGAALSDELIAVAKSDKSEGAEFAIKAALNNALTQAPRNLAFAASRPTTILVVGVNGTGKTTSVAKLMQMLNREGKTLVVAAADTFRAAAIEQLQTWGERIGVPVVAGKFQGDPASVVFDAARRATQEGVDYLIVDTAGRLHTKSNLMDELSKIRRVLEKAGGVDEVLLVVDATTGQNGIVQARHFTESVGVTGLILTKMDGSAKGGVALAIERESGLPIKFMGTGEGADDFEVFDSAAYISGLIGSE